ncbi:MAG: AAA family ATPase [Acidobacteriota bacterium]
MMRERRSPKTPEDPATTISRWTERDLTAAAKDLCPAFQVDEIVGQVSELLDSDLCPIVAGPAGVGKSAVVHELVRRAAAGEGPMSLHGRRVLQMSLSRVRSTLRTPDLLGREMRGLVAALSAEDGICVFFRDMHLAYWQSIEPQFSALALQFRGPIICEGEAGLVAAMFEENPELAERYVVVGLDEPSLAKATEMLQSWAEEQARRGQFAFTTEAVREGVLLSHRFLVRSRFPRKAIDLLQHVARLAGGRTVTDADVFERFCRTHRIPRDLVDPAVPLDLDALKDRFEALILGQNEAVESAIQMISRIKSGLTDVRRPFGVYLYAGPTGVGKTLLAQCLAEYLFGSRDRMIRLNMADYRDERAFHSLFGNPDAHTNSLRRGLLTQRLMGQSLAVLLLDEFEKAHERVHDGFLQLFDEGSFINGDGEVVSCRSCLIIATTNAGSDVYRRQALGFTNPVELDATDRELDRRLHQVFRFEFLNRFDEIVHFHPLTREDIRTIARRELSMLAERTGLKQRRLAVEVDESLLDWLMLHGYDPLYGARFLRRTVERRVASELAEAIVRSAPCEGARIVLGVQRHRVTARVAQSQQASPAQRESVILPVGTTEVTRRLEKAAILQEVGRLIERASRHLSTLELKRAERSRLLAHINQAGFWDNARESKSVVDRYREVDLEIQAEQRLADPVQRLVELRSIDADRQEDLRSLARAWEVAARAVGEWESRAVEQESASAIWLLVSNADPLRVAGKWVRDVAQMELHWCARLELAAAVVGYEATADECHRVAIEIEGPGAEGYLTMEEGIHRLRCQGDHDARARVEIVTRSQTPPDGQSSFISVARRTGLFGIEITCRGRLVLPERGLSAEFLAGNPATLNHLLCDLDRAWRNAKAESSQVARVYAEAGGARDHRTGAFVPRLKDVLRGNLDRFLEAHRRNRAQ